MIRAARPEDADVAQRPARWREILAGDARLTGLASAGPSRDQRNGRAFYEVRHVKALR